MHPAKISAGKPHDEIRSTLPGGSAIMENAFITIPSFVRTVIEQ
jgi:hypothetical protein